MDIIILDKQEIPKEIKYKTKFKSEENAKSYLKEFLNKLHFIGYIESSIDSAVFQSNIIKTYLFLGKKYYLKNILNGNIEEKLFHKLDLKETATKDITFSNQNVERIQYQILNHYENRGFPFAEVFIDSFQITNQEVEATLFVSKNLLFFIDSLIVIGNTKTTSRFIQNFLGIKKGDLYNKSKITNISQKLKQLSYLKETKGAQIVFLNGKVNIILYLEKQKSNQLDLLLGIQPNDQLIDRKITISGIGKIQLENSFGVGEEIFAEFKQLKPESQNLDIRFKYPYFFNLPFGVKGDFSLFKNENSFLNINSKASVLHSFNGINYIELFYENSVSNILNFDTADLNKTEEIPNELDLINNKVGVELHLQNLDYINNPRKGYFFTLSTSIGNKEIKENNLLTNINKNIYKNIAQESINIGIHFNLDYHIPILKKHSIQFSNNSEFFISKDVLENEKYRIGGAESLRGFDEQEIFTPYYSIFTLEYHYSLSKNAYFYTFGDVAFVEDERFSIGKVDLPFGFGTGLSLETKGGIFSLSYALGKRFENNIEIKNGKIHFGYINIF